MRIPKRPADEAGPVALKPERHRPTRATIGKRPVPGDPPAILAMLRGWFEARGWTPWPFQEEAWAAYARGESGLIHVPTGAGKTYAAWFGPLASIAATPGRGLRVLYVTPLRAVSRDIEAALIDPIEALKLPVVVESRTGDTPSHVRARQKERLPDALITTPESLSLMLAQKGAAERFANLEAVIVDEWHELLSTKRGTQVELALARLRGFTGGSSAGTPAETASNQASGPVSGLRTWALTATLADLEEAARAVIGLDGRPTLIRSALARPVIFESLLPRDPVTFPWAGHIGLIMIDAVLEALDLEHSTLVFTNTRSQAERWYQALLEARPEWEPYLALHHSAIEKEDRERIEWGLKDGTVRIAVCTSSLDLGVDFGPVERVIQIGSPKGIARTLQRAGRSAHRPGATCHILCVPSHAWQLVELAAARDALERGELEPRAPLSRPLDVLVQHLVTCAAGGAFVADDLFAEVRRTWAYRDLTRREFDWALRLVREGGETLKAYPEFHKVMEVDGRYQVTDERIAQMHRSNIGTITGDATLQLKFLSGQRLGSVEESYVSRLNPGDTFFFAGKKLEFVRMRDMAAWVRAATGKVTRTPRWYGGRLPMSASLSAAMRRTLQHVRDGDIHGPELEAALPLLDVQRALSRIPAAERVLAEQCRTREGHHLFLYPFEGRLVHEGLAALLALRMTRLQRATFSLSVNDYGLELLTPAPFPFAEALSPALFTTERLLEDTLESVNLSELAKRQFRDIARVAGLVFQGYAWNVKTARQLQTSTSLLFDVFQRYDPENLLLEQARREVLEQQFEQNRLLQTLRRLEHSPIELVEVRRPTPLGFPLLVERLSATLSAETLLERIARMKQEWMKPESPSGSRAKKSRSTPNGPSTGRPEGP